MSYILKILTKCGIIQSPKKKHSPPKNRTINNVVSKSQRSNRANFLVVKGRSMTADEYFEQVHEGHQLSKVWYPAYQQNVTDDMGRGHI